MFMGNKAQIQGRQCAICASAQKPIQSDLVPTPRTDQCATEILLLDRAKGSEFTAASFARTLERELAASADTIATQVEEIATLKTLVTGAENWPCHWCGFGHSAAIDAGEESKFRATIARLEGELSEAKKSLGLVEHYIPKALENVNLIADLMRDRDEAQALARSIYRDRADATEVLRLQLKRERDDADTDSDLLRSEIAALRRERDELRAKVEQYATAMAEESRSQWDTQP